MEVAGDEILELAVVVGEHDYRDVETGGLDVAGEPGGVHVADFKVGDHEIEARLGADQGQGFGAGGDLRDAGDLLQVHFDGFTDQQFVEAAVFFQDEGIVEAGDQQDVAHAERHEVLEALKESLRVD